MNIPNNSLSRILVVFSLIATCVLSIQAQDWTQYGNDVNGEAEDDFSGYSVSINSSGNVVAAGAIHNDGNGPDAGHVRVFAWNGTAWEQRGSDIDGEAADDQSGTQVSLNDAGTIIAIGAKFNNGTGFAAGHVRIFEWDGSTWAQMGSDIDGEAEFDESGTSVSLNSAGNVVAIGARNNSGNGYKSGHVRVYDWNGSAWVQKGSDIDGEAADDESGWSVSLNSTGDIVAIGAPVNSGSGRDAGQVRIFGWDGSQWMQMGLDIDGEASGDYSGESVSLNSVGDVVAIGAPFSDGNGTNAGHVRIFEWDGSIWTQRGTDIDGEAAADYSGRSICLNSSGNIVAIGAQGNDGNSGDPEYDGGHVRVYEWNGSVWVQKGSDIEGEAERDISGWSVSLNNAGTAVAIGACLNDDGGSESGDIRVFATDDISMDILDSEQKDFSIYPNPTNATLDIEALDFSDPYNMEITSINGQLIYSKKMVGSSHQLDLSSLQKGVYFITLKSKALTITKKIIKLI